MIDLPSMDAVGVVGDGQSRLELLVMALAGMIAADSRTLLAIAGLVLHTFHVAHHAQREMLLRPENSIEGCGTKLEGIARVFACVP